MNTRSANGHNSLFQRFALRVVLLAVLPVLVVIILLLSKGSRDTNQELRRVNQQTVAQLTHAFAQYHEQTEAMTRQIESDSLLIRFLQRPYRQGTDYANYARSIYAHMHYITVRDHARSLQLFHANHSIPNGFGMFYVDSYLWEDPFFEGFLRDEEQLSAYMLLPRGSEYPAFHPLSHAADMLLYIRKIQELGSRTHAYAVISIPVSELFVMSGFPQEGSFDAFSGLLSYNFTNRPLDEGVMQRLATGAEQEAHTGVAFYSSRSLAPLPLRIIVATPRGGGFNTLLLVSVLLLSIVPTVNYLFYRYWSRMLKAIQRLISQARRALVGDPNFRLLPTDDKDLNVVVTSINYLLQRVSSLLEEMVMQEHATRDAQLLALQHQINPHLIYNTMEMLAGRMELKGSYEESDALSDFAHLFRYNINAQKEPTTLSSELENVERYLAIQRLMQREVSLTQHIEEGLGALPIMRFVLQPLVENSLVHGACPGQKPLKVRIQARREGRYARLRITDNGCGMEPARLEQLRSLLKDPDPQQEGHASIGLRNIASRLKLLYGTELSLTSKEGRGTQVNFLVPLPLALHRSRRPAIS